MTSNVLSELDRHTIALGLDHSWADVRHAVDDLHRGGKLHQPAAQALHGLMALSLAEADGLNDNDRAATADLTTAESSPRVARFLKAKGRLTHLALDLGARPSTSPRDRMTTLAPAVGRLLVTYAKGTANVLLNGVPWHPTGQTHHLETGSYTVSLALPAASYTPDSDEVKIAANICSTAAFQ